MKKALLSPLCSAIVIPGLGQIINQEIKKGLCILGGVSVIFVFGVILLVEIVTHSLNKAPLPLQPRDFWEILSIQDFSSLKLLIGAFALVWLYSVLDAYRGGLRADQRDQGEAPE